MNKMLYLMNVDWSWIKQRPHFIAEGLCNYFNVTVLYKYRYNRKGFQRKNEVLNKNIKVYPIFAIPRIDRYFVFQVFNVILIKLYILIYCKKNKPDFIYITHPRHVKYIPNRFNGKIIYDCMDAHALFLDNQKERRIIVENEKILCDKADYIFASSDFLSHYLEKAYDIKKNIYTIRNAYNGRILPDLEPNINKAVGEKKKILYFGTIASWLDYELLNKSSKEFNVLYYLYGPMNEGVSYKSNDCIIFGGTIEHDELYEKSTEADALIMPFIVDEKIKAVDPVKLYEYINYGKCIISVWYPEISRFEPFVYFYKTYDEYRGLIKKLEFNGFQRKYSEEQKRDFLRNNSWGNRCEDIYKCLNQVL